METNKNTPKTIIADCLLMAAFTSYLQKFTDPKNMNSIIPDNIMRMAINGETKPLEVFLKIHGHDHRNQMATIFTAKGGFMFVTFPKQLFGDIKRTSLIPHERWIVEDKIAVYETPDWHDHLSKIL